MAIKHVTINFDRFAEVKQLAAQQLDDITRKIAQEGRNRVVLSIQSPSPGTTQLRYKPRRVVVAAAPGQTPNTDLGLLVNSIQVEDAGPMAHAVTVGAEYGAPLEFGTAHMEPRPFMAPMAASISADMDTWLGELLL